MPLVVWNNSFELGVEQFDEHHLHLVELLNRTYDSFLSGSAEKALGGLLDALIDYATYHFHCEEEWMARTNYPELTPHRGEHEAFTSRVQEIQKDFHAGNAKLTLEILSFLKNWLTSHILKTDARYGRFLGTKKGVELDLLGERPAAFL